MTDTMKALRSLALRLPEEDAATVVWAIEHIESLEKFAALSKALVDQLSAAARRLPGLSVLR